MFFFSLSQNKNFLSPFGGSGRKTGGRWLGTHNEAGLVKGTEEADYLLTSHKGAGKRL